MEKKKKKGKKSSSSSWGGRGRGPWKFPKTNPKIDHHYWSPTTETIAGRGGGDPSKVRKN